MTFPHDRQSDCPTWGPVPPYAGAGFPHSYECRCPITPAIAAERWGASLTIDYCGEHGACMGVERVAGSGRCQCPCPSCGGGSDPATAADEHLGKARLCRHGLPVTDRCPEDVVETVGCIAHSGGIMSLGCRYGCGFVSPEYTCECKPGPIEADAKAALKRHEETACSSVNQHGRKSPGLLSRALRRLLT